ncbi:MAG: hypothetical protein U9N34_10965 [Candidatus Cloacimonadota bacterium]|nr:hypothetical protein [Candidatus Cloacimonadota bacterium]
MKKIFLLLIITTSMLTLHGFSNSTLQSNQFMMKTNSFTALHKNPANINFATESVFSVGLLNWDISAYNNSFSFSDYNKYNGSFLTQEMKDEILDKIDKSLKLKYDIHVYVVSFHLNQFAYSLSFHNIGEGKFSDGFIDLALNGNEYNHQYQFCIDENFGEMTSYLDFELGYNQIIIEKIPQVRIGVGISALVGINNTKLVEFETKMIAGDSGLSMSQKIKAKNAIFGFGLKGQIGASSQILDNLSVGIAVDNIGGTIDWIASTKMAEFEINVDSLFIAEVEDDFMNQTDSLYSIPSYTTSMPPIFRVGANYKIYSNWDVSMDAEYSYKESPFTTNGMQVSIGTEYRHWDFLPVQMSIESKTSEKPFSTVYGFGYLFNNLKYVFAFESIGSVIPGSFAKGIGISSSIEILF